ncbi:MAG: ROK family protein [Microbacteriaceae bacterium]|nr:MAG: ROK family protein [Microbacteriaceae bacterium]
MSQPAESAEMESGAIRQRNLDACIRALRPAAELTLTELAKATGLSRPTIAAILGDLVDAGLVTERRESVSGRSTAGRPARGFVLDAEFRFVVGIDLGVHTVTAIVSDLVGQIRNAVDLPVPDGIDPFDRLQLVGEVVKRVLQPLGVDRSRLAGVGVAVTGIVDDRGHVMLATRVPAWSGVDIASRIERQLGVPVVLENDVNMAAVAEHQSGVARFADDVVFVNVGEAVNTALILGGRLHRGHNFAAGELGSLSGSALREDVSPPEIDRRPLLERADGGDQAAEAVVEEYVQRIAEGIATVSVVIDPDLLVISGAFTSQEDSLLTRIRAQVSRTVLRTAPPTIVSTALGHRGVAIGALLRAHDLAARRLVGSSTLEAPTLTVPAGALPVPDSQPRRTSLADKVDRLAERSMPGGRSPEPSPPVGSLGKDLVSDHDLRVAVVGVGMRSAIATWVDRTGLGARLVAAVDKNPQARSRAAELFGAGVAFLSDHRALTSADVDAAIVATPDDTHAAIAIDLMRAGIAVYLEKPLAVTTQASDEVLQVAQATGSRLYVGHNMRHMAVVRLMREIIARGEIGEVKAIWCRHFVGNGGDYYFKDWHADRARSNGLLLQKGAHDLDVIHWLAGSYTRDVVAMGDLTLYGDIVDRADRSSQLMPDWFSLDNWPPLDQVGLNPVVDVEDTSMMLMRLESGVLASYQQCHFTPDYWRNYTVIGTEGRLENFGDSGGGVVRVWNSRTTFDPKGDRSYPIAGDHDGHNDADRLTMQEFLDFVRFGSAAEATPVGARYAVAAAAAATESLRDGSTPRVVEPLNADLEAYFQRNQENSSAVTTTPSSAATS